MQGMTGLTFESDLKKSFITWQAKVKANKSVYLVSTKQTTPFAKYKIHECAEMK